jgi:hypothetical protein
MGASMLRIFIVAALIALSGCASITTGTSQEIVISTTPEGAKCVLIRQSASIGEVASTPGTVKVSKDSHGITVTCTKDGYQSGGQFLAAEFEGSTLGNILIGGLIGATIDAADGADNRYPDSASITLLPDPGTGSGAIASSESAAPNPPAQSTTVQAAATPMPGSTQPAATTAVNWPSASNAGGPTENCRLMDGSIASLTPSECFDKRGHLMQGGTLHYAD